MEKTKENLLYFKDIINEGAFSLPCNDNFNNCEGVLSWLERHNIEYAITSDDEIKEFFTRLFIPVLVQEAGILTNLRQIVMQPTANVRDVKDMINKGYTTNYEKFPDFMRNITFLSVHYNKAEFAKEYVKECPNMAVTEPLGTFIAPFDLFKMYYVDPFDGKDKCCIVNFVNYENGHFGGAGYYDGEDGLKLYYSNLFTQLCSAFFSIIGGPAIELNLHIITHPDSNLVISTLTIWMGATLAKTFIERNIGSKTLRNINKKNRVHIIEHWMTLIEDYWYDILYDMKTHKESDSSVEEMPVGFIMQFSEFIKKNINNYIQEYCWASIPYDFRNPADIHLSSTYGHLRDKIFRPIIGRYFPKMLGIDRKYLDRFIIDTNAYYVLNHYSSILKLIGMGNYPIK